MEVRSLMGLVGYYKRSIERFFKIAHPITYLKKRRIKFEWTSKCEESFKLLKKLLTSAPISKITDPNKDFLVCTYPCKEGLSGVFTRNDLDLAAIVHSLKMWRHYLMGNKFELRTDHSGLKYLFEQQTLNVRQTRWLEFLSEYDFDIKHIKGKKNKIANALDIRVHVMHATTISMHKSYLNNMILEVIVADGHYLQVKEGLQ